VAGPLGLFTYGNTAQFQNNYAWWVFVWAACFWSGAFVAAICLGLLRKRINQQEMVELRQWRADKKIQHKHAATNVKLLFTHPKQAFQKMNVYSKNFKQKHKIGALDYWINCGEQIQKWFELWGDRFGRFGKRIARLGKKISNPFVSKKQRPDDEKKDSI
jgi:hypothetical protein